MKKIVLLLFAAAALQAAPSAQIVKYGIYAPDTVQDYRSVELKNNLNRYVLKFVEMKPMGNRPSEFQIRLREPSVYYSFSRPINNFLSITVNKILSNKISPDFDRIKVWNNATESGMTWPLNFGGEKIELSFFIKENSPILYGRVTRISAMNMPIEVQLNMVVSEMTGGKWAGYDRCARTAARLMNQMKPDQNLTAADRYAVLYDEKLQPGVSKNKNCMGPCFVTWQFDALKTAKLRLQDSYHSSAHFTVKPDARSFEFGVWEGKTPRNLEAFNAYFKPYFPSR